MSYLEQRFPAPELRQEIRDLVNSHRRLTEEPLLLALIYNANRVQNPNDIFIFEVIDRFGDNTIDPDGDFFEVEFGTSTSVDIRLPPGSKVHLVLTNPIEFSAALNKHWRRATEVTEAILRGEFEILFEDDERGNQLIAQLVPPEAAE